MLHEFNFIFHQSFGDIAYPLHSYFINMIILYSFHWSFQKDSGHWSFQNKLMVLLALQTTYVRSAGLAL